MRSQRKATVDLLPKRMKKIKLKMEMPLEIRKGNVLYCEDVVALLFTLCVNSQHTL